jgi:hypothetical protein
MENQADKLFKGKLENHSLPPSANTWEKIENNLEKKSKPIIWWRAAAAILLIGALLGLSYWWTGEESGTPQLAEQKKADSKPETKTIEQTQTPEIDATKKSTEIIKKQLQQSIQTPLAKSTPTEITDKKMDVTQAIENSAKNINDGASEINIAPMTGEHPIKTTTAIASTVTPTKEKPIVLEFKLEPVTTEMVVAAKQEKKGIKTILTDLKNGETNINFHTLKENLLAFNSRKPKTTESQQ